MAYIQRLYQFNIPLILISGKKKLDSCKILFGFSGKY